MQNKVEIGRSKKARAFNYD